MKDIKDTNRRRILALYTLFDNGHELTVNQMSEKLQSEYGITACRQTIAQDIAVLNEFAPIVSYQRGYNTFYKVDYSLWR